MNCIADAKRPYYSWYHLHATGLFSSIHDGFYKFLWAAMLFSYL